MLPALLGTAAGSAAVTIGRGAAAALGNSLSFAGELAKTASSSIAPADSSSKQAGGLPAELSQRISDLTERIRRHLAAAGVQLSKSVELVGDGLGGIVVGGDHPQQGAIERALGEDVLLERDFARLAGDYRECVAQHEIAGSPAMLTLVVA